MQEPSAPVATTATTQSVVPDLRFRILRWAVALPTAVGILIGYMYVHQYNVIRFDVLHEPYLDLTTIVDHWIPLFPPAYWIYALFFVSVFAPITIANTPQKLFEVALSYVLINAIGAVFWILVPTRFVAPPVLCEGLTCDLIRGLHETDAGINVFPSLHTAESVLAAVIFWSYGHRMAPWVTALAVGITASTVLVKNHYVIDLPPGIALGFVAWWLARRTVSLFRF